MNAMALFTQGCSVAMVEYLLHYLKVGGLHLACAQIFFRYTAGKFQWSRKLNRKFRPTCLNFFCYMYELSQRHPVWVAEINVTACKSVVAKLSRYSSARSCTMASPQFKSQQSTRGGLSASVVDLSLDSRSVGST